jgi:hypothetical protein
MLIAEIRFKQRPTSAGELDNADSDSLFYP